MSISRRILIGLLVFALIVLLVLPPAGWLILRRSLPQTRGQAFVSGLQAPAEVIRDGLGIPYIYAANDRDAFFALGYVHAQDRLWQMEMLRRIGAGRLSEVLGEKALENDQFVRTLGVYRAAERDWEGMDTDTKAALQAYVDGVNAFLDEHHPLPPEFVILRFKPEPWLPADSLVTGKLLAWGLGESYGYDLEEAELFTVLGQDRAAQLRYRYPGSGPVILPPGDLYVGDTGPLLEVQHSFQELLGLGGEPIGSNNWVVSGARSASGSPLLANDPHLGAQIPSLWYLVGLHGDRLHAVGATLPGVPAVIIGHNERIAWGVTNMLPDVQDLFVERINPENPNQYEVNGQWVDMEIFPSEIGVKDEDEPLPWAARATRHGPLISDVTSQRGRALALRWTALDPGDTTLTAMLVLNYAGNWEEFLASMRKYVAPSQNFVYADVDGNIGYFAPGRIPIRASGDGSTPVPGWNDAYAWTDWIPFEALPQAFNPAQGYVVTANNRVTPEGYPYFITNRWAAPYRAERITALVTGKPDLTVEDFARFQADQFSVQAAELLPLLLRAQPETPEEAQALHLLRTWDGDVGADSAGAAIYEAWYAHLYEALLGDDLGGSIGDKMLGRHDPVMLRRILSGEEAVWCDDVLTPVVEDCAAISQKALSDALKDLTERLGANMDRWTWGKLHEMQFAHNPFSEISLLKPFFDRSVVTGGDGFTVNPAPFRLVEPYDSKHLPSYRQVIDLGNWNNSLFMHTTGQSGHLFSSHYDDLIPLWHDVAFAPMYWDKQSLQQASGVRTLNLAPRTSN